MTLVTRSVEDCIPTRSARSVGTRLSRQARTVLFFRQMALQFRDARPGPNCRLSSRNRKQKRPQAAKRRPKRRTPKERHPALRVTGSGRPSFGLRRFGRRFAACGRFCFFLFSSSPVPGACRSTDLQFIDVPVSPKRHCSFMRAVSRRKLAPCQKAQKGKLINHSAACGRNQMKKKARPV
jgi:hypothetical protein